jgi:hypothetical protein
VEDNVIAHATFVLAETFKGSIAVVMGFAMRGAATRTEKSAWIHHASVRVVGLEISAIRWLFHSSL